MSADGDNFYQDLVNEDEKGCEHCYRCWYYVAGVPLDEIDYTSPYSVQDITQDITEKAEDFYY